MPSVCLDCKTCYVSFVGGCLSGNGDNDYTPMTRCKAVKALENGWIKEGRLKELYDMYPDLQRLNITSV